MENTLSVYLKSVCEEKMQYFLCEALKWKNDLQVKII